MNEENDQDFMNMPTIAQVSTFISEVFNISKSSINVINEKRLTVAISNEWLHFVSQHGDIEPFAQPLNPTGSPFLNSDQPKLHVYEVEDFQKMSDDGIVVDKYNSFGRLLDLIAYQLYHINWKLCCLTYPDGYNCEDVENCQNNNNLYLLYKDAKHNLITSSKEDSVKIVNHYFHYNLSPIFACFSMKEKTYYVKQSISHSVHDTLMYSPYRLTNSNAKQFFVLFQLLKVFNFVQLNFPKTRLTNLSWKSVALNELLWIQADILLNSDNDIRSFESVDQTLELSASDEIFLNKLVDLWVSGKLSNFEYLMYLNKLAGRKLNDPNNHPILPWISDLSSQESWRDFSKSKYRINKGDDQLQLQYAMAAAAAQSGEHFHVPYHVPDMLSDITFYVYKARVMPKKILQKHVRSYWEPNEYPATIQRMQEWTPDECIPEFFTDPSIFISHHPDMIDLGVPDWCDSPQDFIKKHMLMLESEFVSQRLHDWIDITFGYKLTGKQAVQSLNVCRQLVDQHIHPTSHGIVQLFHSPHPQKRLSTLYSPQKMLFPVEKKATKLSNSEVELDLNEEATNDVLPSKDEEVAEDAGAKIFLPSNYKPLDNLEQLEKLLNFKMSETDQCGLSAELQKTLHRNVEVLAAVDELELTSDRNVVALLCLMVELFMLPHANIAADVVPLPDRLQRAHLYFQSKKFPHTVKTALGYLFKSFAKPVNQVCDDLRSNANARVFKLLNHCGYPPPRPWHLLTETMQVFHFPAYFHSLYDFISLLLKLTNNYIIPLEQQELIKVRKNLLDLLEKLHSNSEGMDLLLLHIIRLLKQSLPYSAYFLFVVFEPVALELGPDRCQRDLLPTIISIYAQVNDAKHGQTADVVESLYDKHFLIQLINRLGLNVFLDTFPRLLADCMATNFDCTSLASSLEWLVNLVGPTLSSKYLIGNLLLVLKSCYCNKINNDDSSPRNDELIQRCLVYASSLFGSSFVTVQYIPHSSYTVSSAICGTGFSEQSYAALVASTKLLITIVPCLRDRTLMDELNRLSKEIILPLIGVLSSKTIKFPQGGAQRRFLCVQTITLLQKIAVRIGREMSRLHLTPLLQSFFNNFSIHVNNGEEGDHVDSDDMELEMNDIVLIPSSLEPEVDSIAAAVRMVEMDDSCTSADNKPENVSYSKRETRVNQKLAEEIHRELLHTFTPETAYLAYVPFARLMGGMHMEQILNSDIVWRLSSRVSEQSGEQRNTENSHLGSISLIGNQIVVEQDQSKPMADDSFHLKGNWLAYWGHEIGLPPGDNHIHFNQIELSAYQGHTSAVKCLHVNRTEDWFLSGSKDKTVKIWSLTDLESDPIPPLFAYRHHKKAVYFTGLVEACCNIISCDGALHVWDPYTGKQIRVFESNEFKANITAVSVLPPPHQGALLATSDSMLRMVDVRSKCLAQEYKSTVGASVGAIRSLCSSNTWTAAGFASGVISLLDHRMGPLLRMWQAHDNEVLCALQVNSSRFITSSLDQTIACWDVSSNQPIMVYRAIPEAVHVLRTYQKEILSATNSNKFLVHALPAGYSDNSQRSSADKPTHVTKLRADTLKGNLTTFAVVAMKRQVVVASESGTLKLLA